MDRLDEFTDSYIETALWSTPSGGSAEFLDGEDYVGFDESTLAKMVSDAQKFQEDNWSDIESNLRRAGHDFWLTRNGHGAGFWDGDWPEPAATRLTKASKKFGEMFLYMGDDRKIYDYD